MKKFLLFNFLLLCILVSSCIYFETINQPSVASSNTIFMVSIHTTTEGGDREPYFGVCLPFGWTIPGDSIQCSGEYNEVIYYNDSLSIAQEDISPSPPGYYWWVGDGKVDTSAIGDVYAELFIQTDNQTGVFLIDYMLGYRGDGCSGGGLNLERSNGHQIEITEEYTPWGLQAVVAGNSVIINWGKPLNTIGLLGYYVYRDEQQINPLLVTDTTFIDENPLEGIHYYCVSSYYSNGNKYLIPYEVQIVYGNSLYVSPYGNNTNSGSSYSEALQTITYALSVIVPDSSNHKTIYLAQGEFSTGSNGEVFPLEWKNYVSLKGISEETTIIDGENLSAALGFNSVTESVFENITIQHCYGNGIYLYSSKTNFINVTIQDNNGTGIECRDNSNPTFEDVTITNNAGSGIYCDDYSSPTLKNVTISNNDGSGIYCNDYSSPTLEKVTISKNTSQNDGGGIYCNKYSSPTLEGVTVSNNSSQNNGGGIFCNRHSSLTLDSVIIINNFALKEGGGIYCENNSNPQLDNVVIAYNSADRGGGIDCSNNSNPHLVNVYVIENSAGVAAGIRSYDSNPILQNVLIANNITSYVGGGMLCYGSNPLLLNVTITGNSSTYYAGIFCQSFSNPILKNCIIWDNNNTEIYVDNSTITISYSDIKGGEAGVIINNGIAHWLDGNRDENPLFAGTGDHPFTLLNGSPCIDAGDPNSIYNDPEDPNNLGYALWPAMGTIRNDMGAYGGPNAASWNIITEIEGDETEELQIPIEFELSQNYPNPFNPSTKIRYSVPQSSKISIKVFDILGNGIETLVNEEKPAGTYEITWYAESLPSGVYFYRIQAGSFVETKKMILLK